MNYGRLKPRCGLPWGAKISAGLPGLEEACLWVGLRWNGEYMAPIVYKESLDLQFWRRMMYETLLCVDRGRVQEMNELALVPLVSRVCRVSHGICVGWCAIDIMMWCDAPVQIKHGNAPPTYEPISQYTAKVTAKRGQVDLYQFMGKYRKLPDQGLSREPCHQSRLVRADLGKSIMANFFGDPWSDIFAFCTLAAHIAMDINARETEELLQVDNDDGLDRIYGVEWVTIPIRYPEQRYRLALILHMYLRFALGRLAAVGRKNGFPGTVTFDTLMIRLDHAEWYVLHGIHERSTAYEANKVAMGVENPDNWSVNTSEPPIVPSNLLRDGRPIPLAERYKAVYGMDYSFLELGASVLNMLVYKLMTGRGDYGLHVLERLDWSGKLFGVHQKLKHI